MNQPIKTIQRDTPAESLSDTPAESLGGFAMVPWAVVADRRLKAIDVRIYGVLAASRSGSGAMMGRRLIARCAMTSQRKLKESIERLVACGHLNFEQEHSGARMKYTLTSKWFGTGHRVGKKAAVAKPCRAFVECPECRMERFGLCKSGICRACNLKGRLRGIVREEVVAELDRIA